MCIINIFVLNWYFYYCFIFKINNNKLIKFNKFKYLLFLKQNDVFLFNQKDTTTNVLKRFLKKKYTNILQKTNKILMLHNNCSSRILFFKAFLKNYKKTKLLNTKTTPNLFFFIYITHCLKINKKDSLFLVQNGFCFYNFYKNRTACFFLKQYDCVCFIQTQTLLKYIFFRLYYLKKRHNKQLKRLNIENIIKKHKIHNNIEFDFTVFCFFIIKLNITTIFQCFFSIYFFKLYKWINIK